MSKFDIHAPMDAPLRARAAREEREHEEALKTLRSPGFQAMVAEVLRKVMRRKKDGTPDRRFGPRMGLPR